MSRRKGLLSDASPFNLILMMGDHFFQTHIRCPDCNHACPVSRVCILSPAALRDSPPNIQYHQS
ncbi:hypothetical protein I7I48_01801 [Histoplasma ohiense]|nr:hypothetical protein I7I48_01801 [Histoplasma ohiense (nom. inval.)]